jgi:hypothetical protein
MIDVLNDPVGTAAWKSKIYPNESCPKKQDDA